MCKTCGIDHDAALHQAVLNVRRWLKQRLELVVKPAPVIKPKQQQYLPNLSAIRELRCPRWFASLNGDLRYQLTPIGAAAPNLHIAKPLSGGKFVIAGGQAGQTISWQVTGVRQDRWAKANPLVVEAPKARQHRGKYVHPKVYGAADQAGIGWIEPVKPRTVPKNAQEEQS